MSPASPFDQNFNLYNRDQTPGLAAMVLRDGQVLYEKCFGLADLASKTPVTPYTNFNLASLAKTFTALGILLLEQAGKLSPDDALEKFMPDLPDYMRTIKIRHLVHHTSGLPDYYFALDGSKDKICNDDIVACLKAQEKPKFPPGMQYDYSNAGYIMLAELIRIVTGCPYAQFIAEEIFTPLGMNNSRILIAGQEDQVPNRATSYSQWPFFERNDMDQWSYNHGASNIYTSLRDYALWTKFLAQPDLLLQEKYHARLFASGKTENGDDINYGYGWAMEDYKGQTMIFHEGTTMGFRTSAVHLPKEKLWIVLFGNYAGSNLWMMTELFLKEFAA